MIKAMLSGITTSVENEAILTLLEFSKRNSDLSGVLKHVSSNDILWNMTGPADARARKLMCIE